MGMMSSFNPIPLPSCSCFFLRFVLPSFPPLCIPLQQDYIQIRAAVCVACLCFDAVAVCQHCSVLYAASPFTKPPSHYSCSPLFFCHMPSFYPCGLLSSRLLIPSHCLFIKNSLIEKNWPQISVLQSLVYSNLSISLNQSICWKPHVSNVGCSISIKLRISFTLEPVGQ